MGFKVDHDKAEESYLIPVGEYETIIQSAMETVNKNGTVYIGMTLKIRNDVEQPCKNRVIFNQLWKRREPSPDDQACQGYSAMQINAISKMSNIPNGMNFDSLAEWLDYLKGRLLRVKVKHEEYKENFSARVAEVKKTLFPENNHVNSASQQGVASSPTVSIAVQPGFMPINDDDDDVPF